MTEQDLKTLYQKMNDMAVDIAEIKTKVNMTPKPESRPCQYQKQLRKEFDAHIAAHDKKTGDWREAVVKGVVDIAKIAVIAGFIAWWAMQNGGGQ